MTFKLTASGLIRQLAVITLPECFLESLAQGQTVISPAWNAESPACRLLAKVVLVAVLCLGDVLKAAPKLHSCVCPKSVSVAALGGAQGSAPRAYLGAVRGFLLLPLLLLPPALRGPSPHPQVVDPVGLWVGDFAEGHFVDGRVFRGDQQEKESGQAERPSAHGQPELGGDTTDTGLHFGTALWPLCSRLPGAKLLRLGSWEGLAFPEETVATKCGFSCPHRAGNSPGACGAAQSIPHCRPQSCQRCSLNTGAEWNLAPTLKQMNQASEL